MEIFEVPLGAETSGKVFPDHIENAEWIGYHGTASGYSPRIEADGFARIKPLPDADIDFVSAVAARCGADPDNSVAGFKTLSSISFTPISSLALAFAVPGRCGGQGVGFVRDIAQKLLDEHAASLTDVEKNQLTRINSAIDSVRASRPVIYAVDLRGLDLARFQTLTGAIHVYEDVPASRLVAKALVPDGIAHDAVDGAALRARIRAAYSNGGPQWFCKVPR